MKSGPEIYKGKKIFCAHFDHLTLEELQVEVQEIVEYMTGPAETIRLILVDSTGTIISPAVLNEFKKISTAAGEKKPDKSAILGMTGPRKVLLEIINKFSKNPTFPFEDKQSALDWLVS